MSVYSSRIRSKETRRVLTPQGKVFKYAAIILTALALGDQLGTSYEKGQLETKSAAAVAATTSKIADGGKVNLLHGGNAEVTMEDGTIVNISNPFIANNGAAIERTHAGSQGEQTAVTAFVAGENGVQTVSYFPNIPNTGVDENPIAFSNPAEALAETVPVTVEASSPTEDYFVAATGGHNVAAGEHLAQGTVSK